MKRLTGLAAGVLCLLLSLPMSARAAAPEEQPRFPAGGRLKIAVFSDLQTNQYVPRDLLDDLNAVLDAEQPDLVVYLGDQVEGEHPYIHLGDNEAHVKSVIEQVLAPVVERDIPFAVVFGNHDAQDAGVDKETQLAFYRSFPNCLTADDDPSLPGCGTCHVRYRSADGTRPVLDLFFIDSLEYDPDGGYGCVSREQIAWQTGVSSALAGDNGAPVPAMVFQHIIVPEVYSAFDPAQGEDTPGAFAGKGIGKGGWYIAPDGLEEAPCPPDYSNGQFAAWRELGSVKAAFFGHDHLNSFTVRLDGIDLVACPGATYTSYNGDSQRGVRIIEIDEDGIAQGRYDTRVIRFRDFDSEHSALRRFWGRPHLWGLELPAAALALALANAVFWPVFLHVRRRKRRAAEEAPAKGTQ